MQRDKTFFLISEKKFAVFYAPFGYISGEKNLFFHLQFESALPNCVEQLSTLEFIPSVTTFIVPLFS